MFGAENLNLKPYSLQKNLFYCIRVLKCHTHHFAFCFAQCTEQTKIFTFKSLVSSLLIFQMNGLRSRFKISTGCFFYSAELFQVVAVVFTECVWMELQCQHCCLTSILFSIVMLCSLYFCVLENASCALLVQQLYCTKTFLWLYRDIGFPFLLSSTLSGFLCTTTLHVDCRGFEASLFSHIHL